MIDVRLLGLEGETLMNTVLDEPPLELFGQNAEGMHRFHIVRIITEDDGGPLVIYRRVL